MHRLVGSLAAEMGAAYPELLRAQPLIEATLKQEETQFRRTLDKGIKLLDDATRGMKQGDVLPGETAFKLYDTYGFPYDLTEDALRAQGFGIDQTGFATAMDAQKAMARAAWKGSGAKASDDVWFDIAERVGSTEFTGYTASGFGWEEQVRLRDVARSLKARGVHVLASNSSAPAVHELYSGFEIAPVSARRAVSCKVDGRGPVTELLIT